MNTVNVPLGDRSYSIHIGKGLLEQSGPTVSSLGLSGPCAVITDDHVGPLYLERVLESLKANGMDPVPVTLPHGESTKRIAMAEKCYEVLANHRLERKSPVIALGGGVIGDLGGFVAATYLRGVPFIQIPTTMLAQVDSSVGGKVGVNLPQGKNLVGAFYQPLAVICDLDTLATLDPRELRAGIAEVIKYGVIHDPELFETLERSMDRLLALDADLTSGIVARCCAIKAEVVRQDEKEGGLRAILNFGHTIGHAIEAISNYNQFLHGEAISIGMVLAGLLSKELLGFSDTDQQRLVALLNRTGLPTSCNWSEDQQEKLLAAMALDKKVEAGEVRFVLARSIGKVSFGCRVPSPLLKNVLKIEF
jgi:3-dehydroquinate synthase